MARKLLSIPTSGIPQFDELYVISDLHLGGPLGHQIFNSGPELSGLIDYLADLNPSRRVALLINGDFVDFLAERPAMHFDPEGAVDKLRRVAIEDAAFRGVFTALKNFAAAPNRHLVVNLGNHDLELALPWVRAELLKILADGNEKALAQITLSFEGTGFLCQVGTASVLCVHGNEVDDWNLADYETIRRFGREVLQGRPVESWIPNAGSKLVIEVMNDLKYKYPFVDLLKPEIEAVVPTLLALAPDQRDKLRAVGAIARRLVVDTLKHATGFLGAAEQQLTGRTLEMSGFSGKAGANVGEIIGRSVFETERRKYANSLLDAAEERINQRVDPLTLISADQQQNYLGATAALIAYFRGGDTCEVLRQALQELGEDRSFDPTVEDDTFTKLDDQIGNEVDFVLAGHTHLTRAIARKKGRGWYFNSGTWARLIKLEKEVLEDPAKFGEVFKTFSVGTMEALDNHPSLILRRLTVVAIWADDEGTHGELRHVPLSPDGVNVPQDAAILPVDTTYRFTRS